MGLKRWLLVLSILIVVGGLIVVLFTQSGADERIVETLIPRLEQRLGVQIAYEDIEVSLTAVSFEGFELRPRGGRHPFARVERLGIGVRVGPLLFGDLDLTALRVDGLDLRAGAAVDGAELVEWQALLARLTDPDMGALAALTEETGGAKLRPEIQLVSGGAVLDDGRIAARVSGLSGRFSIDGDAVVTADAFEVEHRGRRLLWGQDAELSHHPDGPRNALELRRPEFDLPADLRGLTDLAGDARSLLAALGLRDAPAAGGSRDGGAGEDAGAGATDTAGGVRGPRGSVKLTLTEATGVVRSVDEPKRRVAIDDVTAEVAFSDGKLSSLRASGGLPGTDARWASALGRTEDGAPALTIEAPDMPLAAIGDLVLPSDHVSWERASADGAVTIELLHGGDQISARGQVALSDLAFSHERIADATIADLDAHLDFKATYDRDARVVHLERLLISRGLARVTVRGDLQLDRLAFDLRLNLPPSACRQVFGAIPVELRSTLEGVQLEGQIALDLQLAIAEEDPEATVLEVALDNRCRIAEFGTLREPGELRRPFAYQAYNADGEPLQLRSGPGTERWTPLSMISPYVIEAVLTTEDGKFRHHAGVTVPELRRAIELNLKKDTLRHGASTITMQLAKNLFLTRERTVARKLQELFFTWYLETYYSKDELLELYLNVIEFGPSLYGIRDAANHYFGRDPHELNLIESVYLVKLLPNPVARHASSMSGEVSERKRASLDKVLQTMFARGRITRGELQLGLTQPIEFYREGDPLPPPRDPIDRGGLRLAPEDEQSDETSEVLDPGVALEPEWSDQL